MADETRVPNGDPASPTWSSTGGNNFGEIDEGAASQDGDTTHVTSTSAGDEDIYDFPGSVIVDGDTITNVTVKLVAMCPSSAIGNNSFGADLLIGGVKQGQVNINVSNDSTYAELDFTTGTWDTDWTAVQADGMQVAIISRQQGMPDAGEWRVTSCDLIVTYTPDAGGNVVPVAMNSSRQRRNNVA